MAGTATDYREKQRERQRETERKKERETEIREGDMNRVEIQLKREILVDNNGEPWWVTAITGSRTTRHLGPIIITPTSSSSSHSFRLPPQTTRPFISLFPLFSSIFILSPWNHP